MQFIEFDKINSISDFFVKYINNDSFILSRFPNNFLLDSSERLLGKAKQFAHRPRAKRIIEQSMANLNLSEAQKLNIERIEKSNTLFVITGQQVGLFGGPLYTPIKIASAIVSAQKLHSKYPNLNFIPLFWLEDNDHDAREAADISYFDANYDVNKISVFSDELLNVPVSEITFDDSIEHIVIDLIDNLPYSQWKTEVAEFLEQIYKPATFWNDASLQFHNRLFAREGLLFAKASQCRISGAIRDMLIANFQSYDSAINLYNTLELQKSSLSKSGFNINANPEIINYCCHIQGKRYVVKQSKESKDTFTIADNEYTFDELKELMLSSPEIVSPKSLLRPIFQDKIFPNALSILGAGEIAYHSLLKEAYNFFDDEIPAIKPRASATFLLPKQKEFLEASGLTAEYFMQTYDTFEAGLSSLISDDFSESQFQLSRQKIAEAYLSLNQLLIEADPSLERTSGSFSYKSIDFLDTLQKKYISAQKKKNFELVQKYRKNKNFIYPNNKLQERSFSAVNFINFFGIEKFVNILLKVADKANKEHIIY